MFRLISRHFSLRSQRAREKGPSLRSQSGQAVLEYILVLVVVVGIALGVLYQLNTAFKKYVQSYFGDYIACLLETGELPAMGGGDGVNADACNAAFEPFSLANGRPLVGGGGDGSGRSGDGDGRGGTNGRGQKRVARNSAARSGSSKLSKGLATPNAERLNSGNTASASVSVKGKKGSSSNKSDGVASGSFRFRTARMGGDEQIPISGRFTMGGQKESRDSNPTLKKVDAKNSNTAASRKLAVNMDAFNKKEEKPPAVNLDISAGDWLRYILIFAILMGIFVFFGGQINQLRKSWDSN